MIGAESWAVTVLRDGYRVSFSDSPPPLSRTPVSFPTHRAGSPRGSSLAARDRGDACQRSLRNRPRSGSRRLQSPFPGGEGLWRLETRDLSLSPERVGPADSIQDGNCRFCTVICQRGGFSSFPGSEGCVLSDPYSSIFEEAIEVHVRGNSLPVPSPEIPDGCGELLYHGRSPSSALAGDPRSPGFARTSGSSRSPSDAPFAVSSEGALVPRVRPSLSSGAFAMGSETGHVLVDGEGPSVDGVRFGTLAPDLHLYSDASCSGWGARLLDQHVWLDQKLLHINLLEMKALFLGLQAFREDVMVIM